jgi:tetratricopeptide (TPR) repeat protein
MDPDYDNLWSALDWSLTTAGDPEVALRITGGLNVLWDHRGIPREAIAALERALNHPRGVGRTAAHAAACAELAQFHGLIGNYAAARSQFEQALSLARELGDRQRSAAILGRFGWLAREQGDSATAWARMTESLAILRELGDAREAVEALVSMAEVAILDEDPARAEALLAESRAVGQPAEHLIGWTLNHLGHAAQLRGDYQRAAQLHQESLELFQSFGARQYVGLLWARQSLGETALGLGHLDEAARWLAQGLALSQTLSDQASIAWCVAGLGSVAAFDEEPERAARLGGAAERLRQSIGCRPAPAARATYERALDVARAQLGEDAFAATWAEGRAMSLEQAIADALTDQDRSATGATASNRAGHDQSAKLRLER